MMALIDADDALDRAMNFCMAADLAIEAVRPSNTCCREYDALAELINIIETEIATARKEVESYRERKASRWE